MTKRVRFVVRTYEEITWRAFNMMCLAFKVALPDASSWEIAKRLPAHVEAGRSYQGGAKRLPARVLDAFCALQEVGLLVPFRGGHALTPEGREIGRQVLDKLELRDQACVADARRARLARVALVIRCSVAATHRAAEGPPSVAPYACGCAGCTAMRIGYAIGIEARASHGIPTNTTDPCRPGAWGSLTNCAVHEGYDLDDTGRCIEAVPMCETRCEGCGVECRSAPRTTRT